MSITLENWAQFTKISKSNILDYTKRQSQIPKIDYSDLYKKQQEYTRLADQINKLVNELIETCPIEYYKTFTEYLDLVLQNSILKLEIQSYTIKYKVLSAGVGLRDKMMIEYNDLINKERQLDAALSQYKGIGIEFDLLVESYSRATRGIDVLQKDIAKLES